MTLAEAGQLLSLISHEVRGPLGVMRGSVRLLDLGSPSLSESQQKAVASALRAGDRVAAVLDQVSTLARWQQGETALRFTAVSLQAVLASVAQQEWSREPAQESAVPRAGITVEVDHAPQMIVNGDAAALESALAHLATALARAQGGHTHLRLSAEADERDGRSGISLRIATQDTVDAKTGPLERSRGGLDVAIAAFVFTAHGGSVSEQRLRDGRLVAFVIWLPCAA